MTFAAPEARIERATRWRAQNRVRLYRGRCLIGFVLTLATMLVTALTTWQIAGYLRDQSWPMLPVAFGCAIVLAANLAALLVATRGLGWSIAAGRDSDIHRGRAVAARASDAAWQSIAYAGALLVFCALAWFMVVNDAAVSRTFFDVRLILGSVHDVLNAFVTNIEIFFIAGILILIWSLVVAIARVLPGKAGRPIRLLAIVYGDLFRGLPAIITIYLIGFGLPLTGLPFLRDLSSNTYAIIALTLTYGAYTSEVYRAGIESVHPSQIAAARSLGLSYAKTLRFVQIPLAIRGIVPPLLNNFISLQKDTALVAIIGTIDAFNQAKIIASNVFNLSAVTTVAIIFVLITIPQARLVDRLIERDRKRIRAGG